MPKKFIVGLGNPGKKYEQTRHNAGFLFLEFMAARMGVALDRESRRSRWGSGRLAGDEVYWIQPQTFMNDSGQALAQWKRREGLDAANLLVVFDDMDLDPGRVRFRPAGSGGSHKGMASIIEHLGTQDFARLRVGVGRPADPALWADYVLRPFAAEESAGLAAAFERGGRAVEMWLKNENPDAIMGKVNGEGE